MVIFKHRIFHQWAKAEGLPDAALKLAIDEIEKGLCEASLGSGLYKKRIAMFGKGKRGGYRTLIAYKKGEKAIFVYGFSKNAQSTISDNELKVYRQLAKNILEMNPIALKKMLQQGKLIEIT